MAQYIDKSTLVAEIEKRMQELHPTNTHQMQVGGMDRDILMWLNALTWVKKILDALEVKEVDLDKPFEGIKVQTSMESGSLDEVIVTTKYKAKKGE